MMFTQEVRWKLNWLTQYLILICSSDWPVLKLQIKSSSFIVLVCRCEIFERTVTNESLLFDHSSQSNNALQWFSSLIRKLISLQAGAGLVCTAMNHGGHVCKETCHCSIVRSVWVLFLWFDYNINIINMPVTLIRPSNHVIISILLLADTLSTHYCCG